MKEDTLNYQYQLRKKLYKKFLGSPKILGLATGLMWVEQNAMYRQDQYWSLSDGYCWLSKFSIDLSSMVFLKYLGLKKINCLFPVTVRKNRVGRSVKKKFHCFFGQKCVFYACFTLIGSWMGDKNFRVGIE